MSLTTLARRLLTAALLSWPAATALAAEGETSAAMMEFLRADSEHNLRDGGVSAVTPYSIETVALPHFVIPLDHPAFWVYRDHRTWFENPDRRSPFGLMVNFSSTLPPDVRAALIFEREGKQYLRWPLSPDDTMFNPLLKQYFEALGVPVEEGRDFFKGRRTSSRSIVITLPNGHSFSFKPSTNRTSQGAGSFQMRAYPSRWASLNVQLSSYFYALKDRLTYLDVAWEAAALAVPPVSAQGERYGGGDIGMSVRLMEAVSAGREIHYSGFVVGDKPFAEALAAKAGMTYLDFWKEAFDIKGKAMAEMGAILGWRVTSAHEQNFRWVIDPATNRVVRVAVLDLSDGHPGREIFEANDGTEFLRDWDRFAEERYNKTVDRKIEVSWLMRALDAKLPKEFAEAFQSAAVERLGELTNLPKERIRWERAGPDRYLVAHFAQPADVVASLRWTRGCGAADAGGAAILR